MTESILDSVKKVVGLTDAYDVFDPDIIMYINTALSTLNQLGIGPAQGFRIDDNTTEWITFLGGDDRLNDAKTYVHLRVRMLFDPPGTAHAATAIDQQIQELAWRLNVKREDDQWTEPPPK